MTKKFISLFDFLPKSKVKAGDGLEEGNFPFFTSSSILRKKIDKPQYFDESIIFGTGGSASIHFCDEPFSTSTDCIIAKTNSKDVNTKFVYYYLFGNIHLIERGFKGAGLKHISKKYIENIEIPIFPIETQNKIVSVLDKASSLIRKKEESLKLLNELLKYKYLESFGQNSKNKITYDSLENYSLIITDGTHQSPKFIESGIPFLFISNIVNNEINYSTKKFISFDDFLKLNKRTPVEKDDILITSVGSYGTAALVKSDTKFSFQRHIAYIKPNPKLIKSTFLFEALKSDYIKFQIEKVVRGIAQKTLNLSDLKKIKIPKISLRRQIEFEIFVTQIYSKKSKIQESLNELNTLYNSLIQKVFNGQLNFNVDIELDSLIKEIDLQKKDNNIKEIAGDIAYLQRLIDKLNTQDFKEKEMYDKAKIVAFQLMNESEDKRRVTQEYDEKTKNIKLSLV